MLWSWCKASGHGWQRQGRRWYTGDWHPHSDRQKYTVMHYLVQLESSPDIYLGTLSQRYMLTMQSYVNSVINGHDTVRVQCAKQQKKGKVTLELDSLGRRVSKMLRLRLCASMSTNMTDQEAPFSPNRLHPLMASSAALAIPIELVVDKNAW